MDHNQIVIQVHPDEIVVDPNQPRKTYGKDQVANLTASFLADGFWDNPEKVITARPHPNPTDTVLFIGVGGNTRIIAGKEAVKTNADFRLRCTIRDLSDDDAYREQLRENALREDLLPIEKAEACKTGMEKHGMSMKEVATIHGLSVAVLEQDLEMLNLPPELRDLVDDGTIPKKVGRILATFKQENHMRKAWEQAKVCQKADSMIAKIEVYRANVNQTKLNGSGASKQESGQAKQQFSAFASAVGKFAKTPYSNGSAVIVAKAMLKDNRSVIYENTLSTLKVIVKALETGFNEAQAQIVQ